MYRRSLSSGGIVRRILRATQNHVESNLPSWQRLAIGSPSAQSREGARCIPEPENHGTAAHSFSQLRRIAHSEKIGFPLRYQGYPTGRELGT